MKRKRSIEILDLRTNKVTVSETIAQSIDKTAKDIIRINKATFRYLASH